MLKSFLFETIKKYLQSSIETLQKELMKHYFNLLASPFCYVSMFYFSRELSIFILTLNLR